MAQPSADQMIDVFEPATGMAVAPTVATEFAEVSLAELAAASRRPATVFLHLNSDLEVLDSAGNAMMPLSAAMEAVGGRMMPAFHIGDERTAGTLSTWLDANQATDAFVASSQADLVARVRREHPIIRGILDRRSAAAPDLLELRRETNASLSRVILLPQSLADRQTMQYLQRLLITVWVAEEPADVPAAVNRFNLITSGANGIVTRDAPGVIDLLEERFPRDQLTLIRKPFVIGHRGIPALAPENTVEGALLAYAHGADMLENDIHLTVDGTVVIHHDETLERTTTGTGSIAEKSMSELEAVRANVQFRDEYPDAGIPTLAALLEAFHDRDAVHFIEIKTEDPAVIDPLVSLIDEHDAERRVVVISFHAEQLRRLQEQLPGMSVGFVTGGQVSESDPLRGVFRVLETVQPLNATYNPNFFGLGSRFLEAAKHRGITTWPWTFRNETGFRKMFLAGLNGLTTDYSHWSAGWMDGVTAGNSEVELAVGEAAELAARVSHYDRSSRTVTPEVSVLTGSGLISLSGATVTGKAAGTAWVALRHWQDLGEQGGYFMYSAAVRISVTGT